MSRSTDIRIPGTARIMVIPDGHVKPGVDLAHWKWAGMYAARKRPDYIINLGDMADMPSLSSYDKGKKCFEGRSYKKDIDSVKRACDLFCNEIAKEANYTPKMVLTLGNHEQRIERAVEASRELEGTISYQDLPYKSAGLLVKPFLDVFQAQGICFSHYFQTGVSGKPVSSAKALLSRLHSSAVMGHVQQRDIAYGKTANGTSITSIFAGVFYTHDEAYLLPQGNKVWRGIWILHNARNGYFDEMPVPVSYLKLKFNN